MPAQDLNGAEFQQKVLDAPNTVVVDFWAEWCGPCKAVSSILDDLSESMSGSVTFFKLNVDDFADVAVTYGIRSLPTLKLFRGGSVVDTKVGARPRSTLKSWIENTQGS